MRDEDRPVGCVYDLGVSVLIQAFEDRRDSLKGCGFHLKTLFASLFCQLVVGKRLACSLPSRAEVEEILSSL
jgi:hypothetical protein